MTTPEYAVAITRVVGVAILAIGWAGAFWLWGPGLLWQLTSVVLMLVTLFAFLLLCWD